MATTNSFKIERTKPGFTIYRFIGLLLGLALFYLANEWIGVGVMVLAGVIALTSTGKEIDPLTNRMRDFISIDKWSIGKWDALPEIKYIAVVRMVKAKKKFHVSSVSIVQERSDERVYQLNLVVNPHKNNVIRLSVGEMQDSLNQAVVLGKMMNLKVLDFTTPEHKWIL